MTSSSTLQRLLKYPHSAVFDNDADRELALLLTHPSGCAWHISSGTMTVWTGDVEFAYSLGQVTVAGLCDLLRADGLVVEQVSTRFDRFSALVLAEGAGDQGESNGSHVHAFTSLLWVLMSCYAQDVDAATLQVREALLQMVIGTAEGQWLDLWGSLYSVARIHGEQDEEYRLRIPSEAFRLRVNALAIERAILDITGKNVRILEPWTDVFTLDESLLSGPNKFQDAASIGPFYIQPFSTKPIDWSDVIPVVMRNKPAGVIMLPPKAQYNSGVVVPEDWSLLTSIHRTHFAAPILEDLALLDYAEIEETSVPNYPIIHRRTIRHDGGAVVSSAVWPPHHWQQLSWVNASYFVTTDYVRAYRIHNSLATYTSRPWPELLWLPVSWVDANVLVGTSHSQS